MYRPEEKSESVVPLEQKCESEAPESGISLEQKCESEAPESGVPLEQNDESKAHENVDPPEQKAESEALGSVVPLEQIDESKATENAIPPEPKDESKGTENVIPPEQGDQNEVSKNLAFSEVYDKSKAAEGVVSPETSIDIKVSGDLVSTEQRNDIKTPEGVICSEQNDRREACEGQIPPKQTIELDASEGHLPFQQNEIVTSKNKKYPDRKVIEFARITWSVKNLILSDTRSYCVKSSNFRTDESSETLWYLGLEWSPEFDRNRERATRKPGTINLLVDQRYLLLNLVKLPNKKNPEESVKVSFAFGIKTARGIMLSRAEHIHFGRNHRRPNPAMITIDGYEETYTFICQLIIYNYKKDLSPRPSNEMYALKQVQTYLRDLWKSRKYADLTILTVNQKVAAHKYILHARSDFFRKMIDDNFSNVLYLKSESSETINQLLYFVYTGDIDVVAKGGKTTFQLLECAKKLEIEGIYELITLSETSLLTLSPGISVEYQWIIKNYSSYEDGAIEYSPEQELLPMETHFNNTVKYRIKFVKNGHFVGLFAEVRSNQKADVLVEISMLDYKGSKVNSRSYTFTSPETYFGGDIDFALVKSSRYYIPKIVNDDSITVVIKLNFSQCNYTNSVKTSTTPGVAGKESGLKKLSQDMSTVLKEGLGSDMIIKTTDKEFKVHKVILRANSVAFKKLAKHIDKGEVLECLNVPGNVMEAIIKFLYAGRLEETDVDVLYEIYEATSQYDAGCLRGLCFERLNSSFSAENVCKLLHKCYLSESSELVEAAIHFICCNAETIFLSTEWKELTSKIKTLENTVVNRCKDLKN